MNSRNEIYIRQVATPIYLIIWAVPFLNCMFAQFVIFLASKDPFDNTFSFHSTIFNTLEPTFGHL